MVIAIPIWANITQGTASSAAIRRLLRNQLSIFIEDPSGPRVSNMWLLCFGILRAIIAFKIGRLD